MDPVAHSSAESDRPQSADALFEQVYDRLKAMAGKRLSQGSRGTLDTTGVAIRKQGRSKYGAKKPKS